MWIIVAVAAWLALGYLGARVVYKYYPDRHSDKMLYVIFMWIVGPFSLIAALVEWNAHAPKKNTKQFWDRLFNVKGDK